MGFYKDTPGNRKLGRANVGYGKDIGKTQGGGGAPDKPAPKPTGSFYKDTPENRKLGRAGVGYGPDLGKTDPSVKGAKPIKIPKENPKSIIIKKGISSKKDISNLKDFDKQKKKIVDKDIKTLREAELLRYGIQKQIKEHNEEEEDLILEIQGIFDYADELQKRIDSGEGKTISDTGEITIEKELKGLIIGKDSVLSEQRDNLNRWDKDSYILDKKLKKIESDIENLEKLIEGKVSRNKDNKILKEIIKREQNEIKKYNNQIEKLLNKSKNKELNVGQLNTLVNEIQYINRAIERKTKRFKLAKPRPIGSVAQPTIKSATASIKFNETVEDPRLIKALKRLEVLANKPKSIIVQALIREQQFIIRRFREAMRIRGLMIKLK